MMQTNFNKMEQMVALARKDGVNLRVNAYQAVKTDTYRLAYSAFWEGYRQLFAEGLVVSCSEPVVRAVMGLADAKSPCGWQSIRFNPRGQVIPCVYWPVEPDSAPSLEDLHQQGARVMEDIGFQAARQVPTSASACLCQGGCASRRALNGKLNAHDDYCPWVREDEIKLFWQPAPTKNLMRAGNVCTTILM
jgi:MoaA/NifB/PqqE/SkfB family radical SAM enzyme